MYSFLLTFHIFLACLGFVFWVVAMYQIFRHTQTTLLAYIRVIFSSIVLTGIGLVAIAPANLGHFCATASVALSLFFVMEAFYHYSLKPYAERRI
jgi:asparagine N-glycosylation enzyme membrane subunit Stt3